MNSPIIKQNNFFSANEGNLDRLLRAIGGTLTLIGAFFWFSGALQIIFYIISAILLLTAITGFCGFYTLLKINTNQSAFKISPTISIILIIIIALAGSYTSHFFTKKFFLEDFNKANNFYKQALFYTGQNNQTEALKNFELFNSEYSSFSSKYAQYRPFVISMDEKFNSDLNQISQLISESKTDIDAQNLSKAHLTLEKIRPITQDILKRNGYTLLAVSLVDFHDSMEIILDAATNKDSGEVVSAYIDVNNKLLAVEQEENGEDIQNIRLKLEDLLNTAKLENVEALPQKGNDLKTSFVKVYLVKG